MIESFRQLLEYSQQQKKGLTFYVGGQTISGVVVAILDDGGTVEVANQTQSRVAIRLDRVDGIGRA